MNLNTYEIEATRTVYFTSTYRIEAETISLAEEYLLQMDGEERACIQIDGELDGEDINVTTVKFICR